MNGVGIKMHVKLPCFLWQGCVALTQYSAGAQTAWKGGMPPVLGELIKLLEGSYVHTHR